MTDRAESANHEAREKAAATAREWTRRAVLDMVRQSGGGTVSRPVFRDRPDLDMATIEPEPIAGLSAVRHVEYASRRLARDYIRHAREDGHTWYAIGIALDLVAEAASRVAPLAEAAYDYATAPGSPAVTFAWTCPACMNLITDFGPEAGPPADAERGHKNGCQRLAADQRTYDAAWEGLDG